MTSISAVGDAEASAVPKAKSRNLSLDRARTFLTLVVLLHHAVIPYTYFGHTDPKSFFGFDMIVLATDSFFMAMFFFLSGLFAWSGIARKGPLSYLSDRLLRIALPFVICAFTVIPLAYYAISLRHHPEIGFSEFWWNMVTKGPWPSGPIWFLGSFSPPTGRLPPPPAVTPSARSDRPPLAVWPPLCSRFLRSSRCPSPPHLMSPGLIYLRLSSWLEFGLFSV